MNASNTCETCGVTVTDQTPSMFYPNHDETCGGALEEPSDDSSDAPEAPVHYSSSEAFAWQAGWESRGGSWPDAPMPSDETLSDIENRVYAQYQNKIAGMAGALIREGWIAALRAVRGVR